MTLSTRIEEFKGKHAGRLTRIAKERCMYKVHEELRDVNEKAYQPVLLAIGPYNDQGKVGHGFMEEHKLSYLQQMLNRKNGSVETYITALKKLKKKTLKCYGDQISQTDISDDQLVEMMVLDGCFIIELFHKHEIGYRKDDLIFEMKWVLPRIARDLLLFENQLPFFVLAKLFEVSERNITLNQSRHLGEHTVEIDEEEDGISVESSTSAQISSTRLIDQALNFFCDFLPFKWNVDSSSYNSTEKIEHLLRLAHEAHNPSLPKMVRQRLKVGFKFKKAKFEHLLGLIHATICISLLDTEIDHAREREEAGVKLKNAEIFKRLFGLWKAISYAREFQRSGILVQKEEKLKHLDVLDRIDEDWKSIPFGLELQKVGIEFNMANKFKDKLDEIDHWSTIPYHDRVALQEAGIELKEAKKFTNLHDHNRNEDRKSIPYVLVEKFARLLYQIKIETWKSIPYGKELREAGVEFNKAKKFKRLHDLTEIEHWTIHSATELEEAGIKFKKAEKSNVISIKFNNGLMEISPLTMHDHTETHLRNLIAYEQYCHRPNNGNYVSNYVRFMDHLINSPKDVELLRRRGIIYNNMGDDKVISTMVNKLGDHVSFPTNTYARTIMDVNMHCRRRRNVWMAKLRRDYFNSPWALVSFMGAVLLLALAITQTIFSIIH